MNSFVNNAAKVRRVHRGLAERCDPLLPSIPAEADLTSFDPDFALTGRLLESACQAWGVWIPVATKVLHRKRRRLIPMLDTVVVDHYLKAFGERKLRSSATALGWFRDDLLASLSELKGLEERLHSAGFQLTPVRILEILIWSEVEPQGYYRKANAGSP